MKILAIDGNSIINRAFYGIRPLTTKDGIFTNAVYGFMNILLKLKEQVSPDLILAAFDLRAPTFRHKMFDGYKAGRKPMPPELAMQFPLLKEILEAMGITILEKEGYEADDFLGTVAKKCRLEGKSCFIATGDRDSLQLVSDNTVVLLAATKAGQPVVNVYTPDEIMEVYGVSPRQMIDVKALMGDASDKIPGVAGVGEKTALSLIQKFGSLDGVYENIDSSEIKAGVRTKLQNDKENAYLSYKLGTICCDVPEEINFEELSQKPADKAVLARKMAKLELFKLIDRMKLNDISHDDLSFKDGGKTDKTENKLTNMSCVVSPELPDFSLFSAENPLFMLCESKDNKAAAVSLIAGNQIMVFTSPDDIEKIITSGVPVITHDLKSICRCGYSVKNPVFDTMLCAYVLNPSANGYDLPRLCAEYSVETPEISDLPGEFETLCMNCARLSSVYQALSRRLDDGQKKLLTEIEIPLSMVLADMEITGFLVDAEGIRSFGEGLTGHIAEIQASIYKTVGYEFNLNSPKQLAEALFVKLGIPPKKKTKSGFSTNADVLEELKDEYPVVSELLEYRQLAKLKSTYVDGLLAVIGDDGRIHSTFNQTETRTGRISSSEPNLQNIPVRRELGREMRKFFIAPSGNMLCDADYSQIELRVLAHMAKDSAMTEIFNNGGDIHTSTAAKVFGIPDDMVTPLMRTRAKAVNFGIVYGIGAFSLAKDLGIRFGEAKQYIKSYMDTFSGVADYMEKTVEQAKTDGFVETLFSRRRYLPELTAGNAVTRSFGERVARNMPVQGTAADIIKIAMVNVWKKLKSENMKAKLILQVHDELIVEAPADEYEKAAEILKTEMEKAVTLSVPLTADCNTGKSWYEAH